jgi:RsiW-degrading membrane proteinase PrsW (M82 family)
MQERSLQGALTFLGFAISLLAVFYFGVTYLRNVNDWTRLAALVLLALTFAFLAIWVRGTSVGQPFFPGPRLAWLRPATVLHLASLFCGIVAEIFFLGIDDLADPVKVLVSLVVGIGLVVGVARMRPRPPKAPTPPDPPGAPPASP